MIIVILVILTLMLLGNGAQAVAPWRYGYSALGVITLVILFLLPVRVALIPKMLQLVLPGIP